MLKRITYGIVCALMAAAPLHAQDQKAAQEKKAAEAKASENAAPKPAPEPAGMAVNIRIELAITDQVGSGAPAKKIVTMMVGDRQRNSIRSSANIPVKNAMGVPNYRGVTINVDARPSIYAKEPNRMLLEFGLEYVPRSAGGSEELEPGMASLNERIALVLESGKPVIVSQAADPVSDRKITVELTATIVK